MSEETKPESYMFAIQGDECTKCDLCGIDPSVERSVTFYDGKVRVCLSCIASIGKRMSAIEAVLNITTP